MDSRLAYSPFLLRLIFLAITTAAEGSAEMDSRPAYSPFRLIFLATVAAAEGAVESRRSCTLMYTEEAESWTRQSYSKWKCGIHLCGPNYAT